jgi:putative DNA primase/helicase
MTTITAISKDKKTSTETTLDAQNLSESFNKLLYKGNPKTICFGVMNEQKKVGRTQYLVIRNTNKDAVINDEVKKYSYIDCKSHDESILIFPLTKEMAVDEKTPELIAECGRKFYGSQYKPSKGNLDLNGSVHFLKQATINQGECLSLSDEIAENETTEDSPEITASVELEAESDTNQQDEYENQCVPVNHVDEEVVKDDQKAVETPLVVQLPEETEPAETFADEAMRGADEFITDNDREVMFTQNRILMYNKNLGIWEDKTEKEIIKYLLNQVYKSHSNAGKMAKAVVKAIAALAYVKEFPTYQESQHNVLVLDNVAIIPATRKVMSFSPKHYTQSKINITYDPQAICPNFFSFLDATFKGDADRDDKIRLLQEYLGLSLTNNASFQQMLILYGNGSNGKSIILQLVALLVGDGNVSHIALKDFGNRFALAKLNGKLVNIDSDICHDAMRSEGRFKAVVSSDEITVENKFEAPFKFKPVVKLWVAANVLPKVSNNSYGYYRRIIILTFNNVVDTKDQNRGLIDELKSELPGIFNWALEGVERLLKNKAFTMPVSSVDALHAYECDNNYVKQFFNEKIEQSSSADTSNSRTKKDDLYQSFVQFLNDNNFSKIDSARFGKELKALGVSDGKSGAVRYYNVKLKNTPVAANDDEIASSEVA